MFVFGSASTHHIILPKKHRALTLVYIHIGRTSTEQQKHITHNGAAHGALLVVDRRPDAAHHSHLYAPLSLLDGTTADWHAHSTSTPIHVAATHRHGAFSRLTLLRNTDPPATGRGCPIG